MHLHSSNLRYLDEVVRCGSIRKAAAKLNVASSAVNRRILKLEADLGTPLFERNPRKLQLTAAGEILIHHVRRTLQDLERAESEIEELQGLRRGSVEIVAIEGVGMGLLTSVIKGFRQRYPRVAISLNITQSSLVPAILANGDAHLGIAFNTPDIPGLKRLASATFGIGAIVAPDHPLAGKKGVRLADCVQYPICMADQTISAAPIVHAAMSRASLELHPAIACNSAEVIKAMVREGLGLALKSAVGLEREIASGELVFVPLREKLEQRLFLLHKTDRDLPVPAVVLIEWLRKAMFELEIELGTRQDSNPATVL
ncbi:LysR family transcriptional regulator [Rhizobium rhizogenes]|nr:LysR family transcriptional regulator [Rhizobium rhizogenes]NTH36352.1 LysR family transcriptional regulator [Rhizobium rhizogenes]